MEQDAGVSGPTPTPGPRGSEPLPPDASMDDILARVEHLSGSPGPADPASSAPAPSVPAPAPVAVPDLAAEAALATAVPRAKPSRRGLFAAGGGILAVLIGIGAKILIGVVVVGVGGQVLSSLFGGPFDRLPQSTRDGFEQRLNAAIGSDAGSLSESAYAERYNGLLVDGESRLEDGPLVAELVFLDTMFRKADVATCATAARSEFSSTGATFDLSDKMWENLSQAELTRHIETQVSAVEAAARKAPPQRTVTSDQASSAINQVFGAVSTDQSAILNDIAGGKTRTDQEACTAARTFHDAEAALTPADLALLARFSVSP